MYIFFTFFIFAFKNVIQKIFLACTMACTINWNPIKNLHFDIFYFRHCVRHDHFQKILNWKYRVQRRVQRRLQWRWCIKWTFLTLCTITPFFCSCTQRYPACLTREKKACRKGLCTNEILPSQVLHVLSQQTKLNTKCWVTHVSSQQTDRHIKVIRHAVTPKT